MILLHYTDIDASIKLYIQNREKQDLITQLGFHSIVKQSYILSSERLLNISEKQARRLLRMFLESKVLKKKLNANERTRKQ